MIWWERSEEFVLVLLEHFFRAVRVDASRAFLAVLGALSRVPPGRRRAFLELGNGTTQFVLTAVRRRRTTSIAGGTATNGVM